MVLEPAERRAVELGVAAHSPGGVDQRDAVPDALAQLARELGPAQRIRRQQGGDEQGLALEPVGDFVLEVAAQQPVGGDGEARHGERGQQAARDEQPGGELHARVRGRASGRRKRYPAPRTVSI